MCICNAIPKENIDNLLITLKNPDTLSYAFWLSVFLLIVISLLKYFMAKDCEKKDWGNFILEFPIDVCLVLITIIITGYMQGTYFALGMLLVIVSLIISIVCCILRRESIKYSFEENTKLKMFFFGFLDILISSAWISTVYIIII